MCYKFVYFDKKEVWSYDHTSSGNCMMETS